VSYQLGHSDISTTANLYGKFVPEHFKAGFEEAIGAKRVDGVAGKRGLFYYLLFVQRMILF
jgi:hypothetical protein